ncbi:MAG: hypothetical protein WD355_11880 [Balneolaceae bacterium]
MTDAEPVDTLLRDLAYLQDEAEALQNVISAVPYDEAPPGGRSILEKIYAHHILQSKYYRPTMEKILFSADRVEEVSADQFMNSRDIGLDDMTDVNDLLENVEKQRSLLVTQLSNLDIKDWDRDGYVDNQTTTLYDLAAELTARDRALMKEIAEMVMAYQNEQYSRRELNRKKSRQPGEG